ncbi:MAG: transposase [Gemmataceae bacterium]
MSWYRRRYVKGGTYFFTVVTHLRRPILTTDLARPLLRKAFLNEQANHPFEIPAIVLLPDHLHAIWTLPEGDCDYSPRLSRIKESFTREYLAAGGEEGPVSPSRRARGERGVWQRRFWEHTVEDEDDLKRCLDYSHYNPVKHGLVQRVRDYPWSTFRKFVALGEYDEHWGEAEIPDVPGAEWE